MSYCMICVLGDEFDPNEVLGRITIQPSSVFRCGEIAEGRLRPSETGGLQFEVGAGSFQEQTALATDFLRTYREDLKLLSMNTTVESFFLEFLSESRLDDAHTVMQRDYLPLDLLRIAADVGLGICISATKPMVEDEV